MKQASDDKQAFELRKLKHFPEPDLIIEYYWATRSCTYHMKNDEKLLDKDEGVDYVPGWSLGKMIEGLPPDIMCSEDDELEDVDTYELFIIPPSDVKLAEVRYQQYIDEKLLYQTEATELADAVFKMIMKLKDLGYYDD